MTTKADLIGLGVSPYVANALGVTPVVATAYGATVGSANQIGGQQFLTVCITGTSSFKVPQIGGDTGALLGGPPFYVSNLTTAAIAVYAASNSLGSAVTFYASDASGILVSVAPGKTGVLMPLTVSTWAVVSGCSAG